MSKDEIKHEINKVLDHLSDKIFKTSFRSLQDYRSKQTLSITDRATLDKILSEDKDFLRNLLNDPLKKLNNYIKFSLISSEASHGIRDNLL